MGKRGPRKGTGGRPRKALADRIINGNPGGRPLQKLPAPIDAGGKAIAIPPSLSDVGAAAFYDIIAWLRKYDCIDTVPTFLIEQYCLDRQRWMQLEIQMDRCGVDKTLATVASDYQSQMRRTWNEILSIVNENATERITSSSFEKYDEMEELLTR